MKIVLIGFMGAGKSTVAKALAEQLNIPRVELDSQIVQSSSHDSIPAIFEKDGEAQFRDLETEVAQSWRGQHHVVISTGGGIVRRPENMEALRHNQGLCVYLKATFDTLQCRVKGDPNRPLFSDVKLAKALYESRLPLYERYADITVEVDSRTPQDITSEIVAGLPLPPSAITAKTQICVIIGDPIGHSLSPAMHNAGYQALGIGGQFVFVASHVTAPNLKDAIAGVRAMGIRGITCTIPHKTTVIPLLDDIDPLAAKMGAVNTVVQQDGKLKGYNTDWMGIVRPLTQRTTLQGKRVAVLGAGGAARAAAFGVEEQGASVVVFNRTVAKAETLAREVSGVAYGLEEINRVQECDILIQTTSVGMLPYPKETLIPIEYLSHNHVVMDVVYTPWYTQLLHDATTKGATVIPGAEMFLHQGLAQFSLYTGQDAPAHVMKEIIVDALGGSDPMVL